LCFVSGVAAVPSSGAGLASDSPRTGRATETAGGHISSICYPVRSPFSQPAADFSGTGTQQTAHHPAGKRKKIYDTYGFDFSQSTIQNTELYFCGLTFMPSLYQTGVQDYETFTEQLKSLGCWIVEAEEALRVQDPNGCTDLTVIQDRMEDLKVFVVLLLSLSHANYLK